MNRRCEAILNARPTDWGFRPVLCSQVVGVATVIDASGTVRGACSREGHRANVIRRFGTYPGDLAAEEYEALDRHAACCGAGGSTPHWVGCPEHPKAMAPGELVEMYGR